MKDAFGAMSIADNNCSLCGVKMVDLIAYSGNFCNDCYIHYKSFIYERCITCGNLFEQSNSSDLECLFCVQRYAMRQYQCPTCCNVHPVEHINGDTCSVACWKSYINI